MEIIAVTKWELLIIGQEEYLTIYWTNQSEFKKNSLLWKFEAFLFQSFIIIGLPNWHFIVLSNQE